MYNAFGADVELLRTTLLKRYGKPREDYSFDASTMITPDEIEFVASQRPLAVVVNHCTPGQH